MRAIPTLRLLHLSLMVPLLMPLPGFSATAGGAEALAREHGCLACHGLTRKQVGPGFAQIAGRYGNDPAAPSQLTAKIRDGSVGAWGRVIMPRQPHVTDTDAKALAGWILSQPAPSR
jgi:cytochrome c